MRTASGFSGPASSEPEFLYRLSAFAFAPEAGAVGGAQLITIHGQGFSSEPSQNAITIGGQNCDIQAASPTRIACLTPPAPMGLANVSMTASEQIALRAGTAPVQVSVHTTEEYTIEFAAASVWNADGQYIRVINAARQTINLWTCGAYPSACSSGSQGRIVALGVDPVTWTVRQSFCPARREPGARASSTSHRPRI